MGIPIHYSKKLAPIWDELGAKVQSSAKDIIIAKMDATENDLPPNAGYQVQGFPTIKLIKANSNEILEYSGDRSVEAFMKFLESNAVNQASLKETTASGAAGGDSSAKGAMGRCIDNGVY